MSNGAEETSYDRSQSLALFSFFAVFVLVCCLHICVYFAILFYFLTLSRIKILIDWLIDIIRGCEITCYILRSKHDQCFFLSQNCYLSRLSVIVKPDPVQKLSTTYVSATSCNLTWQHQYFDFAALIPLVFRVEYSSHWSSNVTVSDRGLEQRWVYFVSNYWRLWGSISASANLWIPVTQRTLARKSYEG